MLIVNSLRLVPPLLQWCWSSWVENPAPLAEHDLRRAAVAHWVKTDLMLLWHVDPC